MTEAEYIQKLKVENEELRKKLSDTVPEADKLNDVLGAFKNMNMDGLNKTIAQLEKRTESINAITELLSKMTKKDVEKLMKK